MVENFDDTWTPGRWSFSPGAEFPGAAGSFERTANGHSGRGGELDFDFTGGGSYVAAIFSPGPGRQGQYAAMRVWLKKPPLNRLLLRYTDQTGQTLQKTFYAPDDEWADVQINLTGFTGHWGGANDGVVHGPPAHLAIMVDNSGQVTGSLLIDDLQLVPGAPDASLGLPTADYVATNFVTGWKLDPLSGTDPGMSGLTGKTWRFDFTRGAPRIAIRPDESTLPGMPQIFRVRFSGDAGGHMLELDVSSHRTTFANAQPVPPGPGEHVVEFDAPPGPGWASFNGEHDNALHGPLRIAGLFLQASGKANSGSIDLKDIEVKAAYPPQRAWVMTAGLDNGRHGPCFAAYMQCMKAAPQNGILNYTVRDWDGNVVDSGKSDIRWPLSSTLLETLFLYKPAGHSFLDATFTADFPGEIVPPVTATYTAPIGRSGSGRLEPTSPWGMGVYLCRYYGADPNWQEEMDRAAAMAQAAGVKWSRENFSWTRVEPRRGQFDWSNSDRMVDCANRHGIEVVGILSDDWAPWSKAYTEDGIADYAAYAAAVAQHYAGKITFWEIWNEPNIYFWQGPRDMYADLLKQAYAAIKATNPQAMVLGCCTSEIDLRFIKRVMDLGGQFDILSVHPYRAALYDPSFTKDLKAAADLVAPRRVWITEMGWSTSAHHNDTGDDSGPTSERDQADNLARAYIDAIGSGLVERVAAYDFRDDGVDPFEIEYNMGIVRRDFTPKAAYRAYATMTGLLDGLSVSAPLDLGPGVQAYSFSRPGAAGPSVVALWGVSGDRTIDLPAGNWKLVTNLMGDTRPLPSGGAGLKITLREGVPVFLR